MADLIEDVCRAKGGAKAVTDYVDLSYSQIRKMAGDGSIPSLAQVVRFVELAGPTHPFRQALIAHLAGIFDPTPEQIAADITARVEAGTPVREAVREGLEFVELRPGQWVRHR